jgi:hypothetical protein
VSARAAALLLLSAVALCASCSESSSSQSGSAPDAPPTLATVSPPSGLPGTAVTLGGADFELAVGRNLVFFGSAQAVVTSAETGRLVCEVPPGVSTGAVQITVSTRAGTSAPRGFTAARAPGAPAVGEVRTAGGSVTVVAYPGQQVRVLGSGFSSVPTENRVWIGTEQADVDAASASELTVTIPGRSRSGVVAVETGGDASTDGPVLYVCGAGGGELEGSRLGSAAPGLLRGSPYTHLVVEVDVQDDGTTTWEPQASALDALRNRLSERLHKPGGIVVLSPKAFRSSRDSWSGSQIAGASASARELYSRGNTAVVHLTFFAGAYAPNSRVIGLTFRATEIGVFEEALRDRLGPGTTNPSTAEEAVMVHEVGHVLGLVNIGSDMCVPHEDPASSGHDVNSSCVMNAEISIRAAALSIQGTDYDADCKCDLRQAGGR